MYGGVSISFPLVSSALKIRLIHKAAGKNWILRKPAIDLFAASGKNDGQQHDRCEEKLSDIHSAHAIKFKY